MSCYTSCDQDHMPLHCPKKRKSKNKRKAKEKKYVQVQAYYNIDYIDYIGKYYFINEIWTDILIH